MDEGTSERWFTLEAKALRLLRDRGPSRRGFSCSLRLFVEPSFDPWSVYELHVPNVPPLDTCLGFITVWDHPADRREVYEAPDENPLARLKRHAAPLKPTLTRTEVQIPRDRVASLIDAVARQTLPVSVSGNHFGLDGTSFELIFGHGFCASSFRWWSAPPDEWEALGDIADQLVSAIDEAAGTSEHA